MEEIQGCISQTHKPIALQCQEEESTLHSPNLKFGVWMGLLCSNNALGGGAVGTEATTGVWKQLLHGREKEAVKTFFCEIAADKALSTQQCVGEEKCALNLLYLLHE